MREFSARGIVLESRLAREADLMVSIFTKDYGKVVARAASGKKIVSKLGPHLQPGLEVIARFVDKKEPRLVDALSLGKLSVPSADLHRLDGLLAVEVADPRIYEVLCGDFSWVEILSILGWGPENAKCDHCGYGEQLNFSASRQGYYCFKCAPSVAESSDISLFAY